MNRLACLAWDLLESPPTLALVTHGSALAKQPALRTQTVEIEPAAVHWRNAKALSMMLETSRKLGAEGGRRRWSAADAFERTKHAQVMARARWRSHCRRLKERAQASAAAWR
jgi:hypothetical protein